VGPSRVSGLRFFFVSPMSVFCGNFSLVCILPLIQIYLLSKLLNEVLSNHSADNLYYVWMVNVIYIYTEFPKTSSVFGVLSLLLQPSTIFVHWCHCHFSLYLKVYCLHTAQKQILLCLLCSAWNINQDFYHVLYVMC
jgi:hypothetical protein